MTVKFLDMLKMVEMQVRRGRWIRITGGNLCPRVPRT